MPMAIAGGRRDIMKNISPTGKVYQAGTLSGNPIATTAGIKTLEIFKRSSGTLYKRSRQITKKLAKAYKVRAEKQGIAIHVKSEWFPYECFLYRGKCKRLHRSNIF